MISSGNSKPTMTLAGQVHRLPPRCPDAIVVVLMVVVAWANALFIQPPKISADRAKIVMATAEVAAISSEAADVGSVQPSPPVELNTADSPRADQLERPGASTVAPTLNNDVAEDDAASAPTPVAPTAMTATVLTTPLQDATYYREQGIAFYRSGDFPAALADFDRAIQSDPNFADTYLNRGIVLYRMGEYNRAFGDVAQAIRIEESNRTATAPLASRRP